MKKVIVLIIVLVVGIAASLCLVFAPRMQKEQPSVLPGGEDDTEKTDVEGTDPLFLSFSHQDTFYDEPIQIEITCKDEEAEIYYTLDGSTPDKTDTKYKGAINIKSGAEVKATTIKAIAIKSGEQSAVQTKSYVTGKKVFERFDDSTYVFVLSSDPYNLYDYYYGVCVEGYIRDQWLKTEYKGGEIPYNAPANWYMSGRESERDMYVEVYDSKGNQLIDQAAGGRVVGGYSRATEQKSWRLIARNEYSEGNGKFKYPFFGVTTDAYGQLMTRYDRITLRNNANDREFASVRDEIAMELAKQAGLPDTQETVPAAVFLNGKYYGFAWLHEAYCNDYLESTYGGNKENFKIVGGKESAIDSYDDEQSLNDYNYMLDLAKSGLTNDSSFEEFCSLVDIDNFMLYYAIQVYINNEDWPGNNFKVWRYYPSENEEINSPYLDGKWRFLLFDAEYGMGLYGNGYREPTISYLLNGRHMQGESALLKAVLERDDMKMRFANTICDLMYGKLSYENANKVITEKIELCNKECMYALDKGITSTWANENTFNDSRNQIRDFFKNREKIMIKDMKKVFGYGDEMYTVTAASDKGGVIYLNSVEISGGGSETRKYFKECSVSLSAKAYMGYKFSYWNINGQRFENSEITVDNSMTSDGKLNIKAVYEKTNVTGEAIYISKLDTAGKGDSIAIYNPNSEAVTINNYYLSDKLSQLDRWTIPTVTIEAESELIIVCKNNKEESALQKLVTNFNLKTGETVYLSDPAGNVISKAEVVDMNEGEVLVRRDDGRYEIRTDG
ncbi:MAG TPA: spore coat protein CotH [Ruminococcaceae bacterium]|nr:spore coat protein CotH [Oscillospiraceae bacterium]